MNHNLQDLADKRDTLLLAEVLGFLHDWDKCVPYWKQLGAQFNPKDIKSILETLELSDPLSPTSIGNSLLQQIIKEGRDPSSAKRSQDWRIRLLGRCHDIAHIDKPELSGLGKTTNLISSVFGFETLPDESSSELLTAVNNINQRDIFFKELEQAFNNAVGDTRRPINEVTLWDWGSATAAFWKAIAARYVLENNISENDLKWRILSVRFDGLGFLERSITIGDLIGRQKSLQAALNYVRKLLEETYPLGNEVYRDENGSAFIVPDLKCDSIDGKQLRNLVENKILDTGWGSEFELNGELKPQIHITEPHEKALVLHRALELPLPPIVPCEDFLNYYWQKEITSTCIVCGVRPQGWCISSKQYKREALSRNICNICLERREKRARVWSQDNFITNSEKIESNTIWIDEVADKNGRMALIVGRFNLNYWLNGDMIKTLLVVGNMPNLKNKEPSFSRIQRIWRTTYQFWQEVLANTTLSKVKGRLIIESNNLAQFKPQPFGSYSLVMGMTKLSVLHCNGKLITTDNLCYVAKRLGAKSEEYSSSEASAKFVHQHLINQPLLMEEPTGYGKPNQLRGKLTINKTTFNSTEYIPTIPIIAEPRTFMTLVPAENSLDVIKTIQAKYNCEMGKVRNRLSLHLGVVYFHRRTPLRAALDAGRQILNYESPNNKQCCQVTQNKEKEAEINNHKSLKDKELWHVQSIYKEKKKTSKWGKRN